MKKWIVSALLAGFVLALSSCNCDDNKNKGKRDGCRRCSVVVDVNNNKTA